MIPAEIQSCIANRIRSEYSPSAEITSVIPEGGGSINHSFRVVTTARSFFIKYNSAARYPGMFASEAKGLALLSSPGCIRIPEVLLQAEAGQFSFLLLNYIQASKPVNDFWQVFGRQLAALHRNSSDLFGLDHDNYIGSLKQSNHRHPGWTGFLISERLEPQLKMAVDSGFLNSSDVRYFHRLFEKLSGLIPDEPPSLLHGDLWNGNYMTGEGGEPCIFDPAVYYGHRETDIGMTLLFGGFPPEFYHAYHEAFPLEKGWEGRVGINQLYPLLVHVNLFGSGYASSVRRIISVF